MSRKIVGLLPSSLMDDPAMLAAAEMLDREFERIDALIPLAAPWQSLDQITEPVLSYLAVECAVDVWEPTWTDEKKREVLSTALSVHRRKGTAQAVIDGLGSMGFRARHTNWPDYDGDPYKFKVAVDVLDQGLDEAAYSQIEKSIEENKAGRSHLDTIEVFLTGEGSPVGAGVILSGEVATLYPWTPDETETTGTVYAGATVHIHEVTTLYPSEGA